MGGAAGATRSLALGSVVVGSKKPSDDARARAAPLCEHRDARAVTMADAGAVTTGGGVDGDDDVDGTTGDDVDDVSEELDGAVVTADGGEGSSRTLSHLDSASDRCLPTSPTILQKVSSLFSSKFNNS